MQDKMLHPDSTKKKRPALKKIQRSLNSSMWRRGYISVMKISLIRAEDACTAVRSERGACTAESGSATMAGGVC